MGEESGRRSWDTLPGSGGLRPDPFSVSVPQRGEAEALEGEAATWCLLRHLYVAGPVAHGGPELKGVGEAKTLRQKAAELIQGSNELDVMARVVAWLEALAGQSMDNEEALSGRWRRRCLRR